MSHLTDEQLSALADGALEGGARASAERHLGTCAGCRERLAGLVAQDRALHAVLEHDPGEDYFESFVGRVGGRLRAAGLKGAQAREPEGRSLAEWFRSPRKLALVASVATVVAGVGIVMLTTREVRVPALREKEIESRATQEAPSPPAGARPEARSEARSARTLPAPPALPPAAATTTPQAAAPARDARVLSNRAYEVRRNEAGEDVPVGKPGASLYRPTRSAPAPQPAVPGQPVYAQKQQYAEPLGSRQRTDALLGGARPAPAEGGTPPLAAKLASEAARKGTLDEESTSVTAPRVERAAVDQKEQATSDRLQGFAGAGPARGVGGALDVFDGLAPRPRTLARNAQRLTTHAEQTGVAPAWDLAAAGWERVIPGARGGPLESETRFQLARASFMAWQRMADAKRRGRAMQALDAFLANAPRDARRDTAQAWLQELKP